jgi:hypothetical protein
MALFAFAAAGAVTIVAVALIVLALVFYLVSIIVQLRKITAGLQEVIGGVSEIVDKSAPVNSVVKTINHHLDSGVDLLEGLLVKKAGMEDAKGLVEGLYPGSGSNGFRKFPESRTTKAPHIGEVYTKGALTLARLGREAPIAAASPSGPALRDAAYGSAASAKLYPDGRPGRPASLPKSPVVGTGAPVQYEQREDIGAPRKHYTSRPEAARTSDMTSSPSEAAAPPPTPDPQAPPPDAPKTISWKRR